MSLLFFLLRVNTDSHLFQSLAFESKSSQISLNKVT